MTWISDRIEGGSRLLDADYSAENKIPSPKELNKQKHKCRTNNENKPTNK